MCKLLNKLQNSEANLYILTASPDKFEVVLRESGGGGFLLEFLA